MLFNVYYLNFSKVYEIKMMLSNVIKTDESVETDQGDTLNADLQAKMGTKFLKLFNAEVGADVKSGSTDSQKVLENFNKIEKIQNQRVNVRSIEKIEAMSIPFSSKVAVEREDFDRLSTLAKKYVTAEKKESKLQKALDAANKLIAKLKAEIVGLSRRFPIISLFAASSVRQNWRLKIQSYAGKSAAMRM